MVLSMEINILSIHENKSLRGSGVSSSPSWQMSELSTARDPPRKISVEEPLSSAM